MELTDTVEKYKELASPKIEGHFRQRSSRHLEREPRTVIHVKRAKRFDPMG